MGGSEPGQPRVGKVLVRGGQRHVCRVRLAVEDLLRSRGTQRHGVVPEGGARSAGRSCPGLVVNAALGEESDGRQSGGLVMELAAF